MDSIFDQLARYFDSQQHSYTLDSTHGFLQSSFPRASGPMDIRFTPRGAELLILQATDLLIVAPADEPLLLALAWRIAAAGVSRDPDNGSVCMRLVVSLQQGQLDRAMLSLVLGVLLHSAEILRVAVPYLQQGIALEEAFLRASQRDEQARQSRVGVAGFGVAVPTGMATASQEETPQQQAQQKHEQARRQAEFLLSLLSSADDAVAFVQQHLGIFDDDILEVFAEFAADVRSRDNPRAVQLDRLVDLVVRLRVQQWNAELLRQLAAIVDQEDMRQLVARRPDILSLRVGSFIEQYVQYAGREGHQAEVGRLEQLHAWWVDLRERNRLLAAVLDSVATENWAAALAFGRRTTELHDDRALELLRDLASRAQQDGDSRLAETYLQYQQQLDHWQRGGFAAEGEPMEINLGDSDEATVQRALSLLREMMNARDQGSFLLHNWQRFDDGILEIIARLLAQSSGEWAQGHYRLIRAIYAMRLDHEEAALPPGTAQDLFAELCLLESKHDLESYDRRQVASQQLLAELSRDEFPMLWTTVQGSGGNAARGLYDQTGQVARYNEAKYALEQYASVYRRELAPPFWAAAESDLGDLLFSYYQQCGDEEIGIAAEQHYRNALEVWRRDVEPRAWAQVHNALGELYTLRYERKGRDEDSRSAETNYLLALEERTREGDGQLWAVTQHALGVLYARRYEFGNRAEYSLTAEGYFNQALDESRREVDPYGWATTQHALGDLFIRRYEISGAEEEGRQAEEHFQYALLYRQPDSSPLDWAMTQFALGSLYFKRYEKYERRQDSQAAARHLKLSLQVYKQESNLAEWARTQHALGTLFSKRYEVSSDDEDAQEAVQYMQNALLGRQKDVAPAKWAMTQLALGNLFTRRFNSSKQKQDSLAAARHFRNALTVNTRAQKPAEWAMIQNSLGNLSVASAEASGEEALRDAAQHYRAALEVWTPVRAPALANGAARNLAGQYARQHRWKEAHEALGTALTAVRNQYLAARSDRERRLLMREHDHVYQDDALYLTLLGHLEEALARLDEGRARILAEIIGLDEIALARHGEEGLHLLREARQALQDSESKLHAADAAAQDGDKEARQEVYARRAAAHEQLVQSYNRLAKLVWDLHLVPPSLTAGEIARLRLPTGVAILAFVLDLDQAYALLLYEGQIRRVELKDWGQRQLVHLINGQPAQVSTWIEAYFQRNRSARLLLAESEQGTADASDRQTALNVAQQAMQSALDEIAASDGDYEAGWYPAYRLAFHVVSMDEHPQARRSARIGWEKTIKRTLATIRQSIWDPLSAVLENTEQLIVIPPSLAALLPLHAAAPDHISVGYAPALGIWQQCCERAAARELGDALLVAPAQDLPFACVENQLIAERYDALGRSFTFLAPSMATAQSVIAGVAAKGLLHFAGHASYNWSDPLLSALHCADSPLTLAELRRAMDLRTTRLVTLSACESGVSDVFGSGEEFVGLPAGLLEAGAPAVIASLWPVNDLSTAFLMDRFYELWLGREKDRAIADVLREATQWLRDVRTIDLLRRFARASLPTMVRERLAEVLQSYDEDMAPEDDVKSAFEHESLMHSISPENAQDILDYLLTHGPETRLFDEPYYWAGFAGYGAVV